MGINLFNASNKNESHQEHKKQNCPKSARKWVAMDMRCPFERTALKYLVKSDLQKQILQLLDVLIISLFTIH